MSRVIVPVVEAGGELAITPLQVKVEASKTKAKAKAKTKKKAADPTPEDAGPQEEISSGNQPPIKDWLHRWLNLVNQHKLIVAAILVLLIGAGAIHFTNQHISARYVVAEPQAPKISAKPISGFNKTVPADQYEAQLQAITGQPVTLTVGPHAVPVSKDTIKSWLQITTNKNKTEYYFHVNEPVISASLTKLAEQYAKAPVNQVVVPEDGVPQIAVGGRSGTALNDPNTLKIQAKEVAKTVMDGKGMQFSTPLVNVPSQTVGPEAFDKLLVADINTKKMWAYQKGQLVNSWLVSAGAPATPTPVGQFKIRAKLAIQDMRGNNADGTPYFQPKVRWVSYFYNDSAIHGVYWRPLSWFGAVNSSHGCIGLPEDQAHWIYNWAPVGTPVIVHT